MKPLRPTDGGTVRQQAERHPCEGGSGNTVTAAGTARDTRRHDLSQSTLVRLMRNVPPPDGNCLTRPRARRAHRGEPPATGRGTVCHARATGNRTGAGIRTGHYRRRGASFPKERVEQPPQVSDAVSTGGDQIVHRRRKIRGAVAAHPTVFGPGAESGRNVTDPRPL